MSFLSLMRNSLRLPESHNWIEASNLREHTEKLNDLLRVTVLWTSKCDKLHPSQIKHAEALTQNGWQVYGVIQRVTTGEKAIVLRSIDKKVWCAVFGNKVNHNVKRYDTSRLAFKTVANDWAVSNIKVPESTFTQYNKAVKVKCGDMEWAVRKP